MTTELGSDEAESFSRRSFLALMTAALTLENVLEAHAGGTFNASIDDTAKNQGAQVTKMGKVERTATRIKGFAEPELDFQLMRSLGAANFGGGTPGEIFQALQSTGGDSVSDWAPAFERLARGCDKMAQQAMAQGHAVTGREHFLRASMYWRAAEYFSDPFAAEMRDRGLASRRSFLLAAESMKDKVSVVEIPFEGSKLPGYFIASTGACGKAPTVLVITGFDGTGEELYFQAASAGLERGFNIAIAEGPGQVGAMRFNPDLFFRPDYEKPIGAMVDAIISRPEVDGERLALYGISFGGYFAARAAQHDSRIRALICNSPIVDLRRYVLGFGSGDDGESREDVSLADIDAVPDQAMSRSTKLLLKGAFRRFGVKSYREWLTVLEEYKAVEGLPDIRCPVLAMIGAGEGGESLQQFEAFCQGVSGQVTKQAFERSQGADMHCQVGNLPLSGAVVFDWLTDVFAFRAG